MSALPAPAPRPRTRQECIAAAGRTIALARHDLYTLPVAEQARRAWTPTGPCLPELEARIRALRAQAGITEDGAA